MDGPFKKNKHSCGALSIMTTF